MNKNYKYRRTLGGDILPDLAKDCPGHPAPTVHTERPTAELTLTIDEDCKGDLDDAMRPRGWTYVGEVP